MQSRISKFTKDFETKLFRGITTDPTMVRMLTEELTAKLPWLNGIVDTYTTREAFTDLISERGIHNTLGIKSTAIRVFRFEIKNGKWPKEETMEEYLMKAGYQVAQEKRWVK